MLSEFFASSGFVQSRLYRISGWMQGRARRVHLPLHPAGNMICSAVTKPEAEDLKIAGHERRKERDFDRRKKGFPGEPIGKGDLFVLFRRVFGQSPDCQRQWAGVGRPAAARPAGMVKEKNFRFFQKTGPK